MKSFTPIGFIPTDYTYWEELCDKAHINFDGVSWNILSESGESKHVNGNVNQVNEHLKFITKIKLIENKILSDLWDFHRDKYKDFKLATQKYNICNLLLGKTNKVILKNIDNETLEFNIDIDSIRNKRLSLDDLREIGTVYVPYKK